MNLKQICKWKLITGALLIWTIKLFIRPHTEVHTLFNFILGIAPNLVGAYLLIFGSYLLLPHQFEFSSIVGLRFLCVCLFAMAVVNEYAQKIPLFGRTFDFNDIAASALGSSLAYFVFVKLSTHQARKISPV